jgi:hypothetical protein
MLTRRSFLGTVAALAAGSRVAPAAAAAAPVAPVLPAIRGIDPATFPFWRAQVPASSAALTSDEMRAAMRDIYNRCRRDDGDTLLERR